MLTRWFNTEENLRDVIHNDQLVIAESLRTATDVELSTVVEIATVLELMYSKL